MKNVIVKYLKTSLGWELVLTVRVRRIYSYYRHFSGQSIGIEQDYRSFLELWALCPFIVDEFA
jgi:hypothetical protein